jgi:hypothetical protein
MEPEDYAPAVLADRDLHDSSSGIRMSDMGFQKQENFYLPFPGARHTMLAAKSDRAWSMKKGEDHGMAFRRRIGVPQAHRYQAHHTAIPSRV